MPTGYTAAVIDGISFEKFVMGCARAMGALVMMREEPSDAPIPERFEPSRYNLDKLAEAQDELKRLYALTPEQRAVEASAYHDAALRRWEERNVKRREQYEKYEAMLTKVEAWTPPTVDHIEFKDFMASQLKQSIDFDCDGNHCDPEPKPLSAEAWLGQRVKETQRNIDYHARSNHEEIERTESRNKWIADLRDSIK